MSSVPPYLYYDGARVSTESKLGKELLTWERKPDYRPENNPFPRMLYKAQHRPDGRRSVHESNDALFPVPGATGPVIVAGAAEQFSSRCQRTVNNDEELRRALSDGWRMTPGEALDYLETRDNTVANITAERHASDARMTATAQREAAEVDQSTLKHIPDMQVAAEKKKRGRPRKTV